MVSTDNEHRSPPNERELTEYRAALVALMSRCLARVREAEIPMDALPLQGGAPDE